MLVDPLPLPEETEHAPAVDEQIVEAQEQAPTIRAIDVPDVETGPLRRVEPLVGHLVTSRRHPLVAVRRGAPQACDLVVRHLREEPLSETVLAHDRAQHRMTLDQRVEGALEPTGIKHGGVHLEVAVARHIAQFDSPRTADQIGLLDLGEREGRELVLAVRDRGQTGLYSRPGCRPLDLRDLLELLDPGRHIAQHGRVENALQRELHLEALLDGPPQPRSHEGVAAQPEVIGVGARARLQQFVPDLGKPPFGGRQGGDGGDGSRRGAVVVGLLGDQARQCLAVDLPVPGEREM